MSISKEARDIHCKKTD